MGNWKPAQPNDQNLGGNWWEIFQDPQLNALEPQVNVSNQNLKAAVAQYTKLAPCFATIVPTTSPPSPPPPRPRGKDTLQPPAVVRSLLASPSTISLSH